MFSHYRTNFDSREIALAAGAVLLAGLLTTVSAKAPATAQVPAAPSSFRVCAEPDNLPMSQQSSRSGFEIEVARLLAEEMGQQLDIVWIAQRDHAYFRETIGKDVCDAIMSVPAGFGRLTATNPWYRTGFVFVSRSAVSASNDSPSGSRQSGDAQINAEQPKLRQPLTSFDDPELGKLTIGVPATGLGDTPPVIALTRRNLAANLRPYPVYNSQQMVVAVSNREIDMAVLWGPFAGWFASQGNGGLMIAPTPDTDGQTPLAFDITIGVRKGNNALRERLNTALEQRKTRIAAILAKWHVPLRSYSGEEY